jgi:hypothetical protein
MKKIKILGIISILLLYGISVGAGNAVASGNGRFIGIGSLGTNDNPRVIHGCFIHSSVEQLPNILVVVWGRDHFRMTVLTQVECSDDPAIDPGSPHANFDTIHGWGEGKYNGASGYYVEFIFTDAGEPGNVDWGWIKITDSNTDTVMEVAGFMHFGNHQAVGDA